MYTYLSIACGEDGELNERYLSYSLDCGICFASSPYGQLLTLYSDQGRRSKFPLHFVLPQIDSLNFLAT